MSRRQHTRSLALFALTLPLIAFIYLPIIWLVTSSFSTRVELLAVPTHWIPQHPTLKNYLDYKSAMDAQFQKWLEMGQGFSNLTQKAMSNLTPVQSWMQLFPGKVGRKERDEGEEER